MTRTADVEPPTDRPTKSEPTRPADDRASAPEQRNDEPARPATQAEAPVEDGAADAVAAPGAHTITEGPTAAGLDSLMNPASGEAERGHSPSQASVAPGAQTTAANAAAIEPTTGPATPKPEKVVSDSIRPAPPAGVAKPEPVAPPVIDGPPEAPTAPAAAEPATARTTAAPVVPPAALGTEAVSTPPTVTAAATVPVPTPAAGSKTQAPSGKANAAPAAEPKQPPAPSPFAEVAPEETLTGTPKNSSAADLSTAPRATPELSARAEPPPTPIAATFFAEGAPGQLQQTTGLTTLPSGTVSVDLATTSAAHTTYTRGAEPAQPPVQQVAIQISRAAQEGTDRVTVQLKPAALGRISIELEVGHDNRVIAVIAAERSDTMELLQRDAKALERALNDAGLKADSGSLSFSLKEESGRQNPDGDDANSTNATLTLPGEADGPPPAAAEQQYDRRTAHGGIDIRI